MYCLSPIAVEVVKHAKIDRKRRCTRCMNERQKEYKRRRREALGITHAQRKARKTHCAKGHLWLPENIRTKSDGSRECKICHRDREVARRYRSDMAIRPSKYYPDRIVHCKNGHLMTLENRVGRKHNGRCLTCHRQRENGIRSKDAKKYANLIACDPCTYCADGWCQEIDHIEPVSRGGSKAWDNLTAACTHCNRQKYERSALIFMCERV